MLTTAPCTATGSEEYTVHFGGQNKKKEKAREAYILIASICGQYEE